MLVHLFPDADIPVVQLSIDESKRASWHYAIARQLAPLRDEGVLVMGSGNLVHNLHTYAWGRHDVEAFDWAVRFETLARASPERGRLPPLVGYETLGRDAMLSAPTPDHYLPLLYVLALRQDDEPVSFPGRRVRRRIDIDAVGSAGLGACRGSSACAQGRAPLKAGPASCLPIASSKSRADRQHATPIHAALSPPSSWL